MTYRLVDVEQQYKKSPETEFIPHSEERLNLQVGEVVRLMIETVDNAGNPEGLWVSVKFAKQGKYIGTLLEAPNMIPSLEMGSQIPFASEHIAHIWAEEGGDRWFDVGKLALVSKYMFDNKLWPGKIVRFKPSNAEYSGWIISSGKEPRGYEGDPGNFFPMRLGELARRFPPMAAVLARPIGDTFVWSVDLKEFKKVVPL
ncbi:MAG: DUF2185 domain-containing protein [Candidatus Obscuribacterales bacterium]|nr:DUF2185 domain-containing protein [Candidatus Obscuribacterales bacterium]